MALAGHAVYSGNARLWQGDTTIRGDTIIVDDKTGNLEARGNVRTEMTLDEVDSEDRASASRRARRGAPSVRLRRRQAAGDLHRQGPHRSGREGDVTAEKLELFLKPAANELERAEGYGANGTVIVKEDGRTATGARLTYTAQDRDLPHDRNAGAGRRDDAGRLQEVGRSVVTFQRAVDTVSMSGNGVIRATQSQIRVSGGDPITEWRRSTRATSPSPSAAAPSSGA